MKIEFRNTFIRDIKKLSKEQKEKIVQMVKAIEEAQTLGDLPQLKKLQGEKIFYRIKLGEYRLGFAFESDTVILLRYLHRKEIYRFFP